MTAKYLHDDILGLIKAKGSITSAELAPLMNHTADHMQKTLRDMRLDGLIEVHQKDRIGTRQLVNRYGLPRIKPGPAIPRISCSRYLGCQPTGTRPEDIRRLFA